MVAAQREMTPKQSVTALIRRCAWYVANGVRLALLIDSSDRTVLRFKPGGQTDVLRGQMPIDLHAVLPGFEMTPEGLFSALRPD